MRCCRPARPASVIARAAMLFAGLFFLGLADRPASADSADLLPDTRPVIAIIIDDLGHTGDLGRRALALPGPVAASILPHTPHALEFARTAHLRGKEVLLHQPMQAASNNNLLGPGALTHDLSETQLRDQLYENLASLSYVSGINNHMGSRLTRHTRTMVWLMRAIRDVKREDGPLFFVDSVTTGATVAHVVADAAKLPAAPRNIFLDHVQTRSHVQAQVEAIKLFAQRNGYALAIGHPYPETLDVLERALPELAASGYRLVPVRDLIDVRNGELADKSRLAGANVRGTYRQK